MGKKDLNFTWKQEVSDDLSVYVLKLENNKIITKNLP